MFCGVCGVRCFTFRDEGEVKEVEVEINGVNGKRKVWSVKRDGWEENGLSVNACTLDAGQEGLDLREWMEKGWIEYRDEKWDL